MSHSDVHSYRATPDHRHTVRSDTRRSSPESPRRSREFRGSRSGIIHDLFSPFGKRTRAAFVNDRVDGITAADEPSADRAGDVLREQFAAFVACEHLLAVAVEHDFGRRIHLFAP